MVSFLEVVAIAFVAQLAVLPGEKVQFIIAALSTRYHPLVVVTAAGSAFAGWTVLEILFGRALQRVLSAAVLDALTAVLFFLFAVLLLRSAPDPGDTLVDQAESFDDDVPVPPNVTVLGYAIPRQFGSFVPIFVMMAVGEFGDKTQIVTIGLAAQYGAHAGIWVGEMLAIIPVSLANAYFFHRFSHRFDLRTAHLLGALLFLFFGIDTVLALTTGFSVWETIVDAASNVVLAGL